ncbi:MAG: YdeI/OmpD-associated family protein [Nitrososphaerales archaeon]
MILQVDTAPRKVEVPADLLEALAQAKEVKGAFERLSYTHQKEYVSWIEDAKRPETREQRIRKTLTRIIEEQHNKGSR